MAPEVNIESVSQYFSTVRSLAEETPLECVYRGQADYSWRLLPAILRDGGRLLDAEKEIYRELMCLYPTEFDLELTAFDKLAKMQHFGLPTRLLDITWNPLTALYFATSSSPASDADGAVYCITVPPSRKKYFDSDTVSCIANLSNLSAEEKAVIEQSKARNIADLKELEPVKRLIQFIRVEKPHFLSAIKRPDLHRPLVVLPKLRNRRIIAQSGAFIIFGLDKDMFSSAEKLKTKRLRISGKHKADMRHELEILGIHEGTLFPEIDKAASRIMEKYSAL